MAYKKLGDILVSAGIITSKQLDKALDDSKKQKKRIGEYLIDEKIITEAQLIEVLKLQLGIDYIDVAKINIPTEVATLIPRNFAKKYNCIPVKETPGTLYLAMSDPLNFNAIEDIKNVTKKQVVPMIATAASIDKAIVMVYGSEGVSKAINEMQGDFEEETDKKEVQSVDDNETTAPAIRIVNSIIERGITEGASDIHIEPRDGGLTIRMRIDGVLHKILDIPQSLQSAVISRVKIMANMDIAEKRIPQDGRSNVLIKGRDVDMRISALPTNYGEKIVIRFLEKSEALLSTDGIGLKGKHLEDFNSLLGNSNGVILITGPTGSGKSTTMYTMISKLNREDVNIITLEDPIEYNVDGVNQVQVNDKVGLTFAEGLRSILRQDPDIVSVGEIRDGETAEIAMRAAITGHLVLSTIHTNSAVATLDRLVDIGVEPYLIASALRGVIAQRLVRKICPNCKKSYAATDEELSALGLKKKKGQKKITFYKGKGCPECMNTGYKGRVAVYEILTLNSDIKQAFREGVTGTKLQAIIDKSGFTTMREDGIKLIKDGVTTPSEVIRVLTSTD